MTVLTTVVSRPVNGRAAAAVEQLKQLQQTALDSGAERAAASRVITGPNVGSLQLRIFTESLTHAGEVSSKMWGSDVYRSSADNNSPPAELTGVLRSTVLHFAAPRIAADVVPPIGTVLGIKPHPGRIAEIEDRCAAWSDLWVEAGAMQSFVTSAFTGTAGSALFVTAVYDSWAALDAAMGHAASSDLMRSQRASSDPAGEVFARFQMTAV